MNEKPFKPNWVTLLTILLSSMVILMGATAVAPALEPISEAFPSESSYMISLIITLPALSVALTGFGMGYLADRFGKVKIFVISLAIFTIAGISGFFLNSFETILVGRFILGIGIAGIILAINSLIGEYWGGVSRAKIIGYQTAAIGIGTLVLQTMGGALADIGWRQPFLIYLIGLPIMILCLLSVREPKHEDSMIEQDIGSDAQNRNMRILFCYVVVFLEMFLMFSVPTNFSFYITEMGENLTMTGFLLGVMGISQAVFGLMFGKVFRKMDETDAYIVSFLSMGIGLALLFVPNLAVTFVSMVFVGFSLGILMPMVVGRLAIYSSRKTTGKVMGGYSAALNLGTFASSLALIPIVNATDYQTSYVVFGVMAFVICALCILIRMRYRQPDAKVA